MYWPTQLTVLLILVFFEGVRVQELSVQDANAAIELFYSCKCVKYFQCDNNNTIITNGRTIIERRTNIPSVNRIECRGGSFENEILCCKLNGTGARPKPTSRNPDSDESVVLDLGSKCGVHKTIIDTRIHTGRDDLNPIEGEFPWIAVIFKKTSSGDYKFLCSGSLIHPRVILTINHCVHKKKSSNLRVVVNGKTKLSEQDATDEEKRGILDIVNHPNYNDRLLYNDAALLIVDRPFVIESWSQMNTLCLPPNRLNLEGKRCLVAGWGEDTNGQRLRRLKKVEVPLVNHTRCQSLLRSTALGRFFTLHDSFICAGGEKGKDACVGDGGSPLVCPTRLGSDQYFQAGIVSWGVDCGNENVPGVYTNVAGIMEWINNELTTRQLN